MKEKEILRVPTVRTGDLWTAANQNLFVADSLNQIYARSKNLTYRRLFHRVIETPTASVNILNVSMSSYSFLRLYTVGRVDVAGGTGIRAQLNGDTGNNYDFFSVSYNNTTETLSEALGANYLQISACPGGDASPGLAGFSETMFFNVDGTAFQKTYFGQTTLYSGLNLGQIFSIMFGGTWKNTAAITSILLFPGANNFMPGFQIDLYGIS